jgi:hypothetical protein
MNEPGEPGTECHRPFLIDRDKLSAGRRNNHDRIAIGINNFERRGITIPEPLGLLAKVFQPEAVRLFGLFVEKPTTFGIAAQAIAELMRGEPSLTDGASLVGREGCMASATGFTTKSLSSDAVQRAQVSTAVETRRDVSQRGLLFAHGQPSRSKNAERVHLDRRSHKNG